MKILVTGSAGFIGYHLVENLLNNIKNTVIGVDSINGYYSTKIKKLYYFIVDTGSEFYIKVFICT